MMEAMVRWLLPLALASQLAAQGVPSITTTLNLRPDSAYALVHARLAARKFQFDVQDPQGRRLVVRAPREVDDGAGSIPPVEVRIVAQGDSAMVSFTAVEGKAAGAFLAVMIVSREATLEPEAPPGPGELPKARKRPQLFVTAGGRLWMARGGLYTADSAAGAWRLVLGGADDPVPSDELAINTNMAFVGEDTAIVGLHQPMSLRPKGPLVYRTTDRGQSWSAHELGDLTSINALATSGRSVWVFGTRWANEQRLAGFFRSADGGATWARAELPPRLSDVSDVYRVSHDTAYLATQAFNEGPVFWRTRDAGTTWEPVVTPHDQRVHEVPKSGVRVESMATVGPWLLVREYGAVFVTRADSIQWRRLEGVEHIAADRERDQLFVFTDSLQAAMLDRDLKPMWRSPNRVTDTRENGLEQVLAWRGTGFASTQHSLIYLARDGSLQLVRPRASVP